MYYSRPRVYDETERDIVVIGWIFVGLNGQHFRLLVGVVCTCVGVHLTDINTQQIPLRRTLLHISYIINIDTWSIRVTNICLLRRCHLMSCPIYTRSVSSGEDNVITYDNNRSIYSGVAPIVRATPPPNALTAWVMGLPALWGRSITRTSNHVFVVPRDIVGDRREIHDLGCAVRWLWFFRVSSIETAETTHKGLVAWFIRRSLGPVAAGLRQAARVTCAMCGLMYWLLLASGGIANMCICRSNIYRGTNKHMYTDWSRHSRSLVHLLCLSYNAKLNIIAYSYIVIILVLHNHIFA